jgi:DNA-binding transcriptional ArsR family regulator
VAGAEQFVITTLDQLKAMAEPLRVRIVEAVLRGELTVADLADRTGEAPGRLYHHIDVLLETGLLVVTRRIKKRGTEERWFRAVAPDIVVDDRIFAFEGAESQDLAALVELVQSVLRGVSDELAVAAKRGAIDPVDPGRRAFIEQQELTLTPARYRELCRLMDEWISEAKAESRSRTAGTYRFLVTMFPLKVPTPSKRRR